MACFFFPLSFPMRAAGRELAAPLKDPSSLATSIYKLRGPDPRAKKGYRVLGLLGFRVQGFRV